MRLATSIPLYLVLACAAFAATASIRLRSAGELVAATQPPVDAPDSVQLAALGFKAGKQLIVYYFGGSGCGFCNSTATKSAVAQLRTVLTSYHVESGEFRRVSVVGVAIDNSVSTGLRYLESIGPNAFNEISVGSGWQNEHMVRLIARDHLAPLALPLVVAVARELTASLSPLSLDYSRDSVLTAITGSTQLQTWVRTGTPLTATTSKQGSRSAP